MRSLFDGSLKHLTTAILILLLILVLVVPPISLLDRLPIPQNLAFMPQGDTGIAAGTGGMVTDASGVKVIFYPEHVTADFPFSLSHVPQDRLDDLPVANRAWRTALDALQATGLTPLGPLMEFGTDDVGRGSPVTIQVPLPEAPGQLETLKLVTWRTDRWEILPSTYIRPEVLLESDLAYVPDNVLLVKDGTSHLATAALLLAGDQVPAPNPGEGLMDYVGVHYSRLRGDGGLEGVINPLGSETTPFYLTASNIEPSGTVRADLLINMLLSDGQVANQINAFRQAVEDYGFQGVFLDYRGLSLEPKAGPEFTDFVQRLQTELQGVGAFLVVRVEAPQPISAAAWDTHGYDWTALSQIADSLVVPAPIDPEAYRRGDYPFESLLQYATGRVERHKLAIALVPNSVAYNGQEFVLRPFTDAVSTMMGRLEVKSTDTDLLMRMNRDGLQAPPVYDSALFQFRYAFRDTQSVPHVVHVSDGTSLRYKLSILRRHNIPNVVLDMTGYVDVDPNVWRVLTEFKEARIGDDMLPAEYKIQYEVALDGERKASLAVPFVESDKSFPLQDRGQFRVDATVFVDGTLQENLRDFQELQINPLVADVVAPAPESPVSTDPILIPGPSSSLVARNGPGNSHAQTESLVKGQTYDIIGRNNDTTWIQIEDEQGPVGWVTVIEASTFIQNRDRVKDLPVVALKQPETATSPAPVQKASASHLWGYGVQAHLFGGGQAEQAYLKTRQMGFTWVKQQIRWKDYEKTAGNVDWSEIDAIVGVAGQHNISLLFSVLATPGWAREPNHDPNVVGPPADYAVFATFVGKMAERYCNRSLKAIEVWNEQNLHYEWGNLPLQPADYVRMLRMASENIKRACPSMLVISGALTPTGTNQTPQSRGGIAALDDLDYLRQMLQQGALNYVDAVGAHPSGYNVPPYATVDNYCSILPQTGNAHFGAGCDSNNPHRSFSFQSTMLSYRNLVAQYDASKPIWPTEFGWAVNASGTPYAGYGYALDNNYDEQAEWTVQAYTLMKGWGWVAAPILWNLNFRVIAAGTEREQWGIVDANYNPLPAYDRLKAMPK